MLKQKISAYFDFTKKERRGIIGLLLLILFFAVIPFLYPLFIKKKQPADMAAFKKETDALRLRQDTEENYARQKTGDGGYPGYYPSSERKYSGSSTKGEMFYFDPNTATASDWQRLGVRDKTIATIEKYVARGGHFYKPEDIGKIWGLHKDEVERLLPWVRIVPRDNGFAKSYNQNAGTETVKRPPAAIDINTADTSAFIALPGIGSKLASRIISFREKLGGFYSIDQLGETYGLADSVFQRIKDRLSAGPATVKQFNINTASADELRQHPYIRFNLANAIVQYRNQHGNFSSVEEIKKIMLVTEEIYSKAAPYLKVQ
ncbi:MAG: helix-hairpin-helix domain-containing protein [Ferruginibacter sp.]